MKINFDSIILFIIISIASSCVSSKESKSPGATQSSDKKRPDQTPPNHNPPDQTPPDQTPPNQTPPNQNPPLPPQNPLVVFSYNICWECMTNATGGTAGTLGAQCTYIDSPQNQTTLCAKNMARLIETIPQQSQIIGYDFIAFQEAARWQQIKLHAPNAFQNLKAEAFTRNLDQFVTLYDQTKYTLKHRIDDGFRPNSRPFQILIFNEKIIFINLHNCHGSCVSESFIESHLSRALQANLPASQIANLGTYRIIVAGDFNDHQSGGKIKSFQPFKSAGIPTTVSMKNHLNTCCSTTLPWTGTMGGDYIMDSASQSRVSIPDGYDGSLPHSDHLPVLGLLSPISP